MPDDNSPTQPDIRARRLAPATPELSYTDIDLARIPRRLWEQTLAPLHFQRRVWVVRQVADPELRELAAQVALALDLEEMSRGAQLDATRHRARRAGAPLPTPTADHPTARASVQVNLRLRGDDHARLVAAATTVGLRPTTLARALVLNGAGRILQEHEA